MAPLISAVAAQARGILSSAIASRDHAVRTASAHLSQVGPLAVRAAILAIRDDDKKNDDDNDNKNNNPPMLDPSLGVTEPKDINNTFIFVLFGLIGAAFVIGGIWFFFWAKNGGFYFKQNDWDDYKSTVLRRKGPNGTILSGATESTDLGGGSVYKDVVDRGGTDLDARTEYTGGLTEMTGVTHDTSDTVSTLTGITAGASDIAGRERRRRAREKKEREHEKRKDRKNRERGSKSRSGRRRVGEDGVLVDEEAEEDAKRNLRAYRHERPARVGGLNGQFEGSEWDGSTNPEMSTVSGSELLLSGRQSTPTSTPTKNKERDYEGRSGVDEKEKDTEKEKEKDDRKKRAAGGIRKVYSTADRTAHRENERLRNEAKRLAEKGRAAGAGSSYSGSSQSHASYDSASPRRNYSFQRAGPRSTTTASGSVISGSAISGSVISESAEETDSMISASEREHRNHRGQKYLPAISSVAESEDVAESDLGTKSYRHYIPGISSSIPPVDEEQSAVGGSASVVGSSVGGSDYIEEQRRKRGAQRYSRR